MTNELPTLTPKHIIKALQRAGFFVHHTTGSHYALRHTVHLHLRVTVAFHRKDISKNTLRHIIKQVGMTVEDFLTYL